MCAALLVLSGLAFTPAGTPASGVRRWRAVDPGRLAVKPANMALAGATAANGRIAFTSERDGNREIYAVNPEGGDAVNLTNNPAHDYHPAWSPDGRRLAFVSSRAGAAGDIHVMDADGSNVRRISDRGNITDNFIEGLSWSPDGTRILYVNVFFGQLGTICVANLAAAAWSEGCIADDLLDTRDAAWSPDGKRVAFVGRNSLSVADGIRYDLYVADADGGARRKLADGLNFSPAWSPDGTRLAFARDLNSPKHVDQIRAEIFVVDLDGCGPAVRLTDDTANDTGPAWSPDGAQIAFASSPDPGAFNNKHEIYVMGADGGGRVRITENASNDSAPDWQPVVSAQTGNPIDDSRFFVRQHYLDFLGRSPDDAGLQFWAGGIESCGADARCREVKRINTSAAFFLSIEFQESGFLAYRAYKAAYGDASSPNVSVPVPSIRFGEFLADSRRIGQCVRVGVGDWRQRLEENKDAFALEFVRRARFMEAYPPAMTAQEFVTQLDQRAGGVLTEAEQSQLISELSAAPADAARRAAVLMKVAEDADLRQREFNRAFVLTEYFSYLRRNPDDQPDADFRGWEFWLGKLNQFNGDFVRAEMVRAFIDSIEYRGRFQR